MIKCAYELCAFFMTRIGREKGEPIYSRVRIIFARRWGRMRHQKTKRQEASAYRLRERERIIIQVL